MPTKTGTPTIEEGQTASPLEIIMGENPHMNMAAILTRIERSDAKKMPTLFGQGPAMTVIAWRSYTLGEAALI